jgi:ABC-type nitrate/sulfonate/bicarbonate transport system substrate-binding protein
VAASALYLGVVRARHPAPGAGAKPKKLAVGVLPDGEADLVYLASALGYFAEEGLDVELVRFTRGRRGLGLLERGGVDIAVVGDIALVMEQLPRSDYALLATVGHVDEHLLVVARKDRGVTAPADLAGKRVGIESRMSARYLTHRFLEAHGLGERDVVLVQDRLDTLTGALGRGDIDAIVDPLSDNHPAVRAAPGVELVTLPEPGSTRLSFHAVASRAFVRKNPAAFRVFVRALLRALDDTRARKGEAERALAAAFGVPGARVTDDWNHTVFEVSLDPSLLDALDDIERWARSARYVDGEHGPFAAMIYADALLAERPAAVTLLPAAP